MSLKDIKIPADASDKQTTDENCDGKHTGDS
jgi:hypothetical protein